ncbi:hypothetical protein OKW21_005432 [Catalinimonas alkaloidigena]|uniref:hypothetical protein n=1 Tax=Catalinimonas alkaloidigena TaxID=1075417 RepID=UPI002406EFFF|nr:hypothetical protein [Catalinimonas alkaloidigena]MDF9800169.1 hypothetical protein [Catalinimonas alkaloidigena]
MKRKTLKQIHCIMAVLAMLTIVSFFASSLVAELSGNEAIIIKVKTYIFYALLLMIIFMPALGLSGKLLAGKSHHLLIQQKMRRVKLIVLNGIVLVSLAILLYIRASNANIDDIFQALQLTELLLGGMNIYLMSLMIRDGLKLSRGKKTGVAKMTT